MLGMPENRLLSIGFNPEGKSGIEEAPDGTTSVYTLPEYFQLHTQEPGIEDSHTPIQHTRGQRQERRFVVAPRDKGQKVWDRRRLVVTEVVSERSISDEYEENGTRHGRAEYGQGTAIEDWQQPATRELPVPAGTYAIVTPFVLFVRTPKESTKN